MNELQVFSKNEAIDEVSTSEIKFLLLPAFLAYLTGKKSTPNPADRKDIVTLSNIYFRDYIKRLNEYGVVKVALDPDDDDEEDESAGLRRLRSDPSLESMASSRNEKINQFRQRKQHEEREKELRNKMQKGEVDDDDDVVREYYVTLLKKWCIIALEELDGITLEKKMLQHMTMQEREPVRHASRAPANKQPLKPFILTRDVAMKQAFGLGYPSIPAMTVDEFVDQKNAEGTWAFSNKKIYDNSLQNWAEDPDSKKREDEGYDERQERLEDQEDEDELVRKRQWDEFKDDVKRGDGNRKNMS